MCCFAQEYPDDPYRVRPDRLGEGDHLECVEPSLSALHLRNVALRLAEPLGDLRLGEPGAAPRLQKQGKQPIVSGRAQGLGQGWEPDGSP